MSSPSAHRCTRRLAIIGTTLLTLVVTVVALLQLPPVATWLVRRLVTVVPLNPGHRLEVGRVSGDWVHGLVLENVRLVRNDKELARVDRLKLGYDPRRLRGAEIRLRELTVDGARAMARREGDTWDLAHALRRSADTTGSGGIRVDRLELRDVQLEAELAPDSLVRVRGLNLRAHDLVVGKQVVLQVDQLNAALSPPGRGRWFAVATRGAVTADEFRFDPLRIQTEQSHLAGRVVLPRRFDDPRLVDRLDLRLQATPLALADLAAVVPAVTPEGALRLDASAKGSNDGLVTAQLGARLNEATITLNGSANIAKGAPADYRLRGTLRRLDPADLYRSAPIGSLNGKVEANLRGPTLARSDGRLEFRLTPSRLAGTAIDRLDLHGDVRRGSAEVTLRGAAQGGTLTAAGRVRPFDSIPHYRLTGTATGLPGSEAIARGLAGKAGEPVLDVSFQFSGAGVSPTSAHLTGRVDLTALRHDGDRVPLGYAAFTLAKSRLDARPELVLGGGRITAHAIARLKDTVTYEVRDGTIDRVDLGRLFGDTMAAPLSGRFSLSGQGVSPTTAVATARIELDELRYGARHVEKVSGRARLAAGRAHIEFLGTLQGGQLAIDADARPFDSTATVTLRRASLERVDLGTLLSRPALAGPVTLRARGSGRWRGGIRSLEGRLTVEPSRLGRVEVATGSLDATLNAGRLTYEGSIRTNGGALTLVGNGRPLESVPSFTIVRGRTDSLDLGTLLGRPNLHSEVNAQFTGVMTGGSADSRQVRLSLDLLPSRVNQAELDGGRIGLDLKRGTVRGNIRLEGRDGEVAGELTGQTGAPMRVHTDGTLRLERLARWTGRPDADGRLESRFAIDAVGDSAGLVSLGGTVNAMGGVGAVRINAAHLALRPDSGAIHVDTLFIRSNVAALDGGGRIALRPSAGSDTLRIAGTTGDLAPLAALAVADSVSLDSARLALTVSGPAWHWHLESNADLHRILAADNLAEHMTVRGAATFDSTRVSALSGEVRVENAAYGQVRIPHARLTGRYDSLITVDADVAVGDSLRIAAGLSGVVRPDSVRAVLQRLDLTEGKRDWSLDQPADLMLRPRLEVHGLSLHSGTRRIVVDGIYDLRDSSDIGIRLTNVDLDVLRQVRLAPIGGRLDGWLRLTGRAATPTVEGSIGLTIRGRTGKETGRIRTDLAWTRGGLRLDATAAPLRGGRLTVKGTLPWQLTLAPADTAAGVRAVPRAADTLGLAVRADSFDLGLFEPLLPAETARELHGALVVDAHVSGTTGAPLAEGTVHVTGAALTVPTLDLSYQGGELVGRVAGDQLRIERLKLRTGKKELLTAQGAIVLRPLTDPKLDLTVDLKEFRISNSATLKSMATGKVRLQGTVAAPTLSGALTLGRTDIIVGAAQGAATVEKVELTPQDLRQLARTFGPAVLARANKSPGLVDRFRLDLNLRLPRRVWFRKRGTPKADIELSGRIRLRQDPGQPMQFFGRVEPVPGRASFDLYGREFRLIAGGDITLAGPTDSTRLDVIAQYQVPTQGGPDDEDVLINVAARGHPDSLSLKFTGDPEMSQDDMLSYIVTGRPASDNPLANQSTEQQSAGEAGAEVALSGLTQNLSDVAGRKLGLDVFQIRQEGLDGLTLTAGRYVGSRAFLSLLLPIQVGTNLQQTPGYNLGPGFELEYTMRQWLRGNVRGGSVPPQFTLRSRYAY